MPRSTRSTRGVVISRIIIPVICPNKSVPAAEINLNKFPCFMGILATLLLNIPTVLSLKSFYFYFNRRNWFKRACLRFAFPLCSFSWNLINETSLSGRETISSSDFNIIPTGIYKSNHYLVVKKLLYCYILVILRAKNLLQTNWK